MEKELRTFKITLSLGGQLPYNITIETRDEKTSVEYAKRLYKEHLETLPIETYVQEI
jgi:hypothetical protein